jgi:hypothetical protein
VSTDWRWEYDPDHDHVAGGIPAHVVAEVERLAGRLVELAGTGIDAKDLGNGPRPDGLRRGDAVGGRERSGGVRRPVPPRETMGLPAG